MGMEIIKLLNEFEKEKTKQDVRFWNYYQNGFHYLEDGQSYSELLMISKKYEFIKWLVENDKIDLGQKLFNLTKNDNRKSIICDLDNNDFSWEDTFLMLLSISDTPIEDLISYLK